MHARPAALNPLRLRSCLLALVVAAAVPAFLTAAFAVWHAAGSYRDASGERLLETSRALARAIEAELDNRATLVRTLAAAPSMGSLQPGAMDAWLARAQLAAQAQVVVEPRGAATADGAGDLSPAGIPRASGQRAARSGGTELSNLYFAAPDNSPRVALSTAYATMGQTPVMLSLVMAPQQLVRAAQAAHAPGQDTPILMAVTDGTGRIVARSRDQERFVGRRVPDWETLQALGTPQGRFEATTAEGGKVVFAFQTLRNTPGWVVVVGEPLQAFNARWQQPLRTLAGFGGVAVVLALLLASAVAAQILRPVRLLADNARRVTSGDGDAPAPAGAATGVLRIAELEQLRDSIMAADAALRERAASERRSKEHLAASERRYRAIANAGALVLWSHDARGHINGATGWKELTGQDEQDGIGGAWLEHVHPEDREQLREARVQASQPPYRGDLEIRIRTADGSWRWVRVRTAPVFDDAGHVTEWIGVIEDVHERRKAQARIAHMALHDALTGLANRTALREQLQAALPRARRGEQHAVLYIDLDRFKEVNDTLGHPVGDALLLAVTERLRGLVRAGDTVARLGGDEFVIAQMQLHSAADAEELALRVVQGVGAPYQLGGQTVQIGASVGVHLVTHEDTDPDEVLKKADMALYRAKEEGKGRYRFFEPAMDAIMQERRHTETALRHALEHDEFEMRYQPRVNVRTRMPSGLQARLYWIHPERGELQVRDILPMAAGMGLLVDIGEWILQKACEDVARWPEVSRVAVKVSSTHLYHRNFVNHVAQALQHSGLQPERLELEIGEAALLQNTEAMPQILRQLQGLRVRIVMDDFGSGESALGCLRSFPFDKVKIASSFVRDVGVRKEGDAIVRALTGLCDSMGIMSAVEGVERESQFRILSDEECTEVQGSLFGDFVPAAQVQALVRNWSPLAVDDPRPRHPLPPRGSETGPMGLTPR